MKESSLKLHHLLENYDHKRKHLQDSPVSCDTTQSTLTQKNDN